MAIENIRGASIYYTDSNPSARSAPLVLLHGFPLDSRVWDAQVAALVGQHRVITIDLRGFGQSRCDEPFTLESLADDVHELLRSINALPCVLGGLSMGGYVASAYVKKYRADLKALVLIDTKSESDNAAGKEARNKMIELARTGGSIAVADQMQPRMLAEVTVQQHPEVLRKLRQIMEPCPALTIQHAAAAMRDREDHTAALSTLDLPVLIIVGEHDAITPPAIAQAMKEKLKNATLAIIPSAGHMSPMEQPDAVNDALRKFLLVSVPNRSKEFVTNGTNEH